MFETVAISIVHEWKILRSFLSLYSKNNIKSLKDSGVLIDGVTEIVKHEIKKQECRFLGALLAP